ncbi:MAG TPA: enoyl-CoA hydratase-related protein [Solirubrobacteraceae bacterium]|nr:enoyl-CoA hydratase-related protein [Solirubrobacteraceae bacterium]
MTSSSETHPDAAVAVRREGAVAIVELARPDALNAISVAMGRDLVGALGEIAQDPGIRAVVLTGSGRAFCSGADLKGGGMPLGDSGRPDLGWALREAYNPLVLALREMPQPVVAAVNGVAAGLGCSIALACDHVIAARSASFLLAFVNVALVPDGGASVLVPARAGLTRALELALLGDRIAAERALAWGLVNSVEDDDETFPVALEVARRLASGPPEALAAIKGLFNAQVLPGLAAQLEREAEAQATRSESGEVLEAITAFLEKRRPEWRGPSDDHQR